MSSVKFAVKLGAAATLTLLLNGCLEVDQHPKWIDGEYAGKHDSLPYQANFHNDKQAWRAAITKRTHFQNEYERANP